MQRIKKGIKVSVTVIFILSFVLVAMAYCWGDAHKLITDIYLPAGEWNDEVFYYKQIAAMVKYGIPQGYFGYSEMPPKYGTFGAWSVVLLVPYLLWGKLFGWNVLSPVLANLTMITGAMGVLYYCIRPNVKQMLIWISLIAFLPVVTRYILSGMVETVFFSSVLLFIGMEKRLEKEYNGKIVFLFYTVVAFCSLGRPYYMLFIFIPFFYWYKKHKKSAIGVTGGYSVILTGLYIMINKYICAPYFSPIINTDFMQVLKGEGIGAMLLFLIKKYWNGLKEVVSYLVEAIRVGEDAGEIYLLFCVVVCFLLINYFFSEQKRNIGFTLFLLTAIISAVILFYSVYVGCRHLLPFILYGIWILILENRIKMLGLLSGVFGVICITIPKSEYMYQIPYANQEVVIENNRMIEELKDVMILDENVGWKNTVVWVLNGQYGICYCVPDGYGINICFDNIDVETIKSDYILAHEDAATYESCFEYGSVIWKGNGYVLFHKR